MGKYIIRIICLVFCIGMALSAIEQLLTLSNTIANIVGVFLSVAVLWIGGEIFFKLIDKASKNED